MSGGLTKLANAFVVHPRDLGSNLGAEITYFYILFVSNLNFNLQVVNSWTLFLNLLMWDLTRHIAKKT
jgi:hypothetical protein